MLNIVRPGRCRAIIQTSIKCKVQCKVLTSHQHRSSILAALPLAKTDVRIGIRNAVNREIHVLRTVARSVLQLQVIFHHQVGHDQFDLVRGKETTRAAPSDCQCHQTTGTPFDTYQACFPCPKVRYCRGLSYSHIKRICSSSHLGSCSQADASHFLLLILSKSRTAKG
jgi:hypothetical protein